MFWAAEWPPFRKKLPARMSVCSHCLFLFVFLFIYYMVFRAGLAFACSSSCSLLLQTPMRVNVTSEKIPTHPEIKVKSGNQSKAVPSHEKAFE